MSLKILVVTYNTNKQRLTEPFTQWLFSSPNSDDSEEKSTTIKDKPDIIVIGFQELTPYPWAFLGVNQEYMNETGNSIDQAIAEFISDDQSKEEVRYTRVVEECAVGLALFVYVRDWTTTTTAGERKSISPTATTAGGHRNTVRFFLDNVDTCQVGVGPFWMRNKGALGVMLQFGFIEEHNHHRTVTAKTSICFVCAHLAAHPHNVNLRNQHFKSVCERLLFPQLSTDGSSSEYMTIYDADYLFFFGDLNYRISLDHPRHPPISLPTLLTALRERQHLTLRDYDQLSLARESGKTLHGFEEGRLEFAPTYKFHLGSENYNAKEKTPGWCDRILYFWHRDGNDKSGMDHQGGETEKGQLSYPSIILDYYISHPQCKISDHKPVSALFTVAVPSSSSSSHHRRTFKSPFGIDPGFLLKRNIGHIMERVVGIFWWSIGTRNGLALMSIVGGFGWWWWRQNYYIQ